VDKESGGGGRKVRFRAEGWRAWLAAFVLLGVVAVTPFLPAYHGRFRSGWMQLNYLPTRLGMSLEDIRLAWFAERYATIASVRDRSFEDAVLVISEDPADGEFASLSWCAYFLYPRVLIHPSRLAEHPEMVPDFAFVTPRFSVPGPDERWNTDLGLVPLSPRARRFAEETWR
jgi:hypothetical protein